jgi:hypothetical protein
MIIEIATLTALGSVVLLKFGTVKHMNSLNQKRVELANAVQRHEMRHKALAEQRKGIGAEERLLEEEQQMLESKLREVQDLLSEREGRIRDMEERIENLPG